ncbi:MAG TPA: hypothetical protein VLA98_00870, partial [Solirubrobacteraceae bacterium]|nr:hypothetical protein [Solirubrobacteraceae bacterium]
MRLGSTPEPSRSLRACAGQRLTADRSGADPAGRGLRYRAAGPRARGRATLHRDNGDTAHTTAAGSGAFRLLRVGSPGGARITLTLEATGEADRAGGTLVLRERGSGAERRWDLPSRTGRIDVELDLADRAPLARWPGTWD